MLRWLSLILSMLSYIQPLFFDKHRLFLQQVNKYCEVNSVLANYSK